MKKIKRLQGRLWAYIPGRGIVLCDRDQFEQGTHAEWLYTLGITGKGCDVPRGEITVDAEGECWITLWGEYKLVSVAVIGLRALIDSQVTGNKAIASFGMGVKDEILEAM